MCWYGFCDPPRARPVAKHGCDMLIHTSPAPSAAALAKGQRGSVHDDPEPVYTPSTRSGCWLSQVRMVESSVTYPHSVMFSTLLVGMPPVDVVRLARCPSTHSWRVSGRPGTVVVHTAGFVDHGCQPDTATPPCTTTAAPPSPGQPAYDTTKPLRPLSPGPSRTAEDGSMKYDPARKTTAMSLACVGSTARTAAWARPQEANGAANEPLPALSEPAGLTKICCAVAAAPAHTSATHCRTCLPDRTMLTFNRMHRSDKRGYLSRRGRGARYRARLDTVARLTT